MKRLLVLFVVACLTAGCMPWVPGVLGDVNGDGAANTTDVNIILDADIGLPNTRAFCPMNCGDVNLDGFVNSTDAAIILVADGGVAVPFPVGAPRCPLFVVQPRACQ